jgi:DNA-binding CsgD family transcriptional regulator
MFGSGPVPARLPAANRRDQAARRAFRTAQAGNRGRQSHERTDRFVMTSVGVALLFQVGARQREEHVGLIRDLEVARVQGQRWRSEARGLLNGLGDAIDVQFTRWGLTEAEREVALLLLKGLSLKEVATVRSTDERTVRTRARSLYAKGRLSGRAARSAFFLEDLLAPIEGLGADGIASQPDPAPIRRPASIQ